MTTQPTQSTQPEAPLADRVSRLEGITEQINLRLAENTNAINTLHDKIDRLRGEMHRQGLLVIGVLGGLMAVLRFVG